MVTPTAFGILLQFPLGSQAGMFHQLLRLFRKESVDQGETAPGQREADPLSSETGRRKSFWGRLGESWAELGNILKEVGLRCAF